MYETRGTFCRTELNIAVRVRRVVIPIPTLPGTDSAEINRDSQASILTKMMIMMMMMQVHVTGHIIIDPGGVSDGAVIIHPQ